MKCEGERRAIGPVLQAAGMDRHGIVAMAEGLDLEIAREAALAVLEARAQAGSHK